MIALIYIAFVTALTVLLGGSVPLGLVISCGSLLALVVGAKPL